MDFSFFCKTKKIVEQGMDFAFFCKTKKIAEMSFFSHAASLLLKQLFNNWILRR